MTKRAWCFAVACSLLAVMADAASKSGRSKSDAMSRLDFRKVIRDAKEKVFPAVVFIKCVRESHEQGKKSNQQVSGSGVLIAPNGELITNWHVVDKAVEVRCMLSDGTGLDAEILGTDKDTDLALLRLKRPKGAKPLPYAKLGKSSALEEGDFVMAMGAPWGLSRSVSMGIVSCTRRFLEKQSQYSLWLQTDASISPGNSGGPLVNTRGEVIGLNTLGIMMGGDMGFAVPSDTIRTLLPQLRKHKSVQWGWTGLQLQPLNDFNKNFYSKEKEGVIVAGTDPDSPARRGGIKAQDRILQVNGRKIDAVTEEDLPQIRRFLGLLPNGKPISVTLVRGGKRIEKKITLRVKGKVEGDELDCPRWDFTVKAINQFDNADLYFYRKKGVFVFGIKYPGNATRSGLATNDILLKVDKTPVASLEQIKKIHGEAIKNVDKKYRVVLTVLRQGLMRQVVLDFSLDTEKE